MFSVNTIDTRTVARKTSIGVLSVDFFRVAHALIGVLFIVFYIILRRTAAGADPV